MQRRNHLIRVAQACYVLIVEIILLVIRLIAALLFWSGYLLQQIGAFGLRRIP